VLRTNEIPRSIAVAAIARFRGTPKRENSEINDPSIRTNPPGRNGINPTIG
jgi:hypothetical protein